MLLFSVCAVSGQVEKGQASFYADKFEGRPTASGEKYVHSELTAAHKTLPFGTLLKVTNVKNNRSVVVRVNDRGPFVKGRVVDLSLSAARKLGFEEQGLAKVTVEVINHKEMTPQAAKPVTIANDTYYSLNIDKLDPEGFGIQIGSFGELDNVLALTQTLKRKFRKEVIVESAWINGVKNYRVFVGQFDSRDKAEAFRSKLENTHPDSFVVDFAKR